MAPNPARQMYKKYKDDTNRITEWLVDSAIRCNIAVPTMPSQATNTKPSKTKHRIALDQFLLLATGIAQNAKTFIQMDLDMLSLIRTTIDLRVQATPTIAKLFAGGRNPAAYRRFTANHYHFVGVLERVLEILECAAEACSAAEPKEQEYAAVDAFICGVWMSWPGDDWDVITSPDGTGPSVCAPKIKYEMENDEFEQIMALLASSEDLDEAREYVQFL